MNRLSLKNDRSHTCPNNLLVYKIKIFTSVHVLVKVQWSESVLVYHSRGDQISLSTFKDLFAVQIFFICQIQKNVVEFDNPLSNSTIFGQSLILLNHSYDIHHII
jgi:hypothetical protein